MASAKIQKAPCITSIVIADGDDWQGLYVNGKLVTQGHRITVTDVLDAINFKHQIKEVSGEWLADECDFPESLDDVKFS